MILPIRFNARNEIVPLFVFVLKHIETRISKEPSVPIISTIKSSPQDNL